MTIKTVLCAVDVSAGTEDSEVLQQAATLAELNDAQLDVITVVPDFGMSVVGSFFEPTHHAQILEEARNQLHTLIIGTLGKATDTRVRHLVATGKTYEKILQTAQANKADLIVIGAHQPDLKDYLLGPNAARVVRHAVCSVYVVR